LLSETFVILITHKNKAQFNYDMFTHKLYKAHVAVIEALLTKMK